MTSPHKDKLSPEEIQRPESSLIDRLVGSPIREYARRRTDEAIRQYATLPDGRVDQELAEYIDKKLTQSTAINAQYVMGPGSWVITLAAAARALGEGYNNHMKHGKINGTQTLGKFAVTNSVILLGALAIDAFRMSRHFNGAFRGELDGALASMRKQRIIERAADKDKMQEQQGADNPQPSSNWQETTRLSQSQRPRVGIER